MDETRTTTKNKKKKTKKKEKAMYNDEDNKAPTHECSSTDSHFTFFSLQEILAY